MYNKVDVADTEGLDDPQDINGYFGKTQFYRKQLKLIPITASELVKIAMQDSHKMTEIMTTIKEIDKDHNGYVTSTELDDILKLFFQ